MKFFKYFPLTAIFCLSANATLISTPTQFVAGQKIVAASMNVNFNAVNTVVNGNIDSTNIANGGVITADLADQLITTAKLVDSSSSSTGVTTAKIADQAVTSAKLADSAVTSGKISYTQSYWSGKHLATCLWLTASSGYNTPTADGSCTLTELFNGGMGTVVSDATAYNGTLKLPGLNFAPPKTGAYEICVTGVFDNSASDTTTIKLNDGSDDLFIGELRADGSGTTTVTPITMCGISYASTLASKTITIKYGGQSGNTNLRVQQADNALNWMIHGL